jgi:hypothetical protein
MTLLDFHEDEYLGPPPSTIFGHFKLYLWKVSRTLIYTPETLDDMAYIQGRSTLSRSAVGIYGISKRLVLLVAFTYLFISNYIGMTKTQTFVALTEAAGNCQEIAKPWTVPALYADRNGYWSGQDNFLANEACYSFSLFNFLATNTEYEVWLKTIDIAIKKLGNLAKTQDLGTNLLYWSSWSFSSPTSSATGPVDQTVILAGNPKYIMNNEGIQGTIADVNSDCDFSASSQSYDVSTGTVSSVFDMSSDGVGSFPKCQGIINAKALGWNPTVTGNTFSISIDTIALFTALAVAEQVNGPTTLDKYVTFSEVSKAVWKDGVEYSIVDKYDPGYPGMAPVTCVGPTGSTAEHWNCLLRIGSSYGIPFLTHRGANTTFPVPCECSSNGDLDACDDFNLLLGLIVFDHESKPSLIAGYPKAFQPIIPFLEVFYIPPLFPAKLANRLSFYPAFAAMFGQNNTKMQNATWRSDAYSYTSTNFGTGSIIVINSFSEIQSGVTADNLQLTDGACADQMSTDKFSNFYSNKWGPLVENYYQCTMLFSDAVLNASGIASGTAGLIVPVCILFIFYICMGLGAWKTIRNDAVKELNEKGIQVVVNVYEKSNKQEESKEVEYEEIEYEEEEYEEVECEEEFKETTDEDKKEIELVKTEPPSPVKDSLGHNLVSWLYLFPNQPVDESLKEKYTDQELLFMKYLHKRQLEIEADEERYGELSLIEMRKIIVWEFRAIMKTQKK